MSGMTGRLLFAPEDMDARTTGKFPMGTVTPEKYLPMGKTDGDEKERIQAVIEESRGNLSEAARKLGMSRVTLYARLERLGVKELYVNRSTGKR